MPGRTHVLQTCNLAQFVPAWTRSLKAARNAGNALRGPLTLVLPLALAVICPAAALAGPCSDEIARLEAARGALKPVPYTRQSVAAQLHHQPTPGTVAEATSEAQKRLEVALVAARKLNSEGKDSECLEALQKVGVLVNGR
jgi:hypothetical protein